MPSPVETSLIAGICVAFAVGLWLGKRRAQQSLRERAEHAEQDQQRARHEAQQAHDQQQQLLARLQLTEQALHATNRELEAFAFSVSHDLRAPLRHVRGFAELWLSDVQQGATRNPEYVDRVLRAAARMDQLIDALLALSRVSRHALNPQPVDMTRLVQTVWTELADRAEHARANLQLQALPSCTGDPNLLHQLWFNLLDNALKYSAGTPNIVITVRSAEPAAGAADASEKVGYQICDNGIGFDPGFADRLFQPFQRLHASQDFAGTGIGLSIVHRIVVRHGGTILATSQPGQGACFQFWLGQVHAAAKQPDASGLP